MIDLPLQDEPVPAGAGVETPAPRFCGTCGEVVAPGAVCAPCSARPVLLPDQRSRDKRALLSPLALYAFLLVTLLGGALLRAAGVEAWGLDGIVLERYVQALHSVVVLGWCLVHRDAVRDGLHTLPNASWFVLAAVLPLGTFAIAHMGVWCLTELGVRAEQYSTGYLAAGYGWAYI